MYDGIHPGHDVVTTNGRYQIQVGDRIVRARDGHVEVQVTEDIDLVQAEAEPLLGNFGCVLLRPNGSQGRVRFDSGLPWPEAYT